MKRNPDTTWVGKSHPIQLKPQTNQGNHFFSGRSTSYLFVPVFRPLASTASWPCSSAKVDIISDFSDHLVTPPDIVTPLVVAAAIKKKHLKLDVPVRWKLGKDWDQWVITLMYPILKVGELTH